MDIHVLFGILFLDLIAALGSVFLAIYKNIRVTSDYDWIDAFLKL